MIEAKRPLTALAEFLRLEAAGGVVLIGAAVLAMAIANSPLAGWYRATLLGHVALGYGSYRLDQALLHWINDGLMAIFFLLVGLELKREFVAGQLRGRARAILPGIAALGGMALPALVFVLLNLEQPDSLVGWAIPCATDIAFALGVLALLGPRVPSTLKLLLTAIAVLDDLGAIVIIALFYTDSLSLPALLAAAALLAALFGLNRIGVARAWPYLLVGLVLWVAVLKSGVHATLAGVAVGFALPLNHRSGKRSPLIELEQRLHPWVAFGVLPLFAFANAGVPLRGLAPAIVFDPLPLGIALGLLLGKSLGIGGSIRLALRFGVAALPEGIERRTLPGLGLLCGIGFTMSLFIASLAFESSSGVLMLESRIGILLGSTVAALAGFLWLKWIYRRP